ncbi:hypothetical protein F4801DRAFT_215404 [Xylaria longipes]|nr:hypothetical protein F4801DRAFT_215404 [Xylaria longipes]
MMRMRLLTHNGAFTINSPPNVDFRLLPCDQKICIPETLISNLVSPLLRHTLRVAEFCGFLSPRLIEYIKYIPEWLKIFFSPSLSAAEYWLARVAIVVLPLVFIHGVVRRVSDLIHCLVPLPIWLARARPQPIRSGRVSVDRFVSRMNGLWFGFAYSWFEGNGIVPRPRRLFLLSPIINGYMIAVFCNCHFGGKPLTVYI